MTCYVDDMRAPYRGGKYSHMICDSRQELDAMAIDIGLALSWIQHPGTHKEHYDVSEYRRQLAIKAGAVAVSMRVLAVLLQARRYDHDRSQRR